MFNFLSEHFKRVIFPLHVLSLLVIPFWEPQYLFVTLVGWIMISGYGAAIGLHRYVCHNAFKTNKFFEVILLWLACLASQGSPIFWNAVHLHHHSEADNERDFHTPKRGWWQAYWGWIINLDPAQVPMRYSRRLIKDGYHKFLHQHYYRVVWGTVSVALLIDIVLTGTFMYTLYGLVIPMTYGTHQEPIINLLSHIKRLGYRNYDTKDDSNNIWWLGLLTFGQAYHNNHHAMPHKYNYGSKWWEIDLTVPLITIIKR